MNSFLMDPFRIDVKGSPPGMLKKFELFRFGYKGSIRIGSLPVRQNGDASSYDRKVRTYQIGEKGPFRMRPFRIGEMRTSGLEKWEILLVRSKS